MKKIADFLVNKRILVLVVMLTLAVICSVVQLFVPVNADMTKYLPDNSKMKIGMDIMKDDFPKIEDNYTIRVMFNDLTDAQKGDVLTDLKAIANVKSVDYEAGNARYNKDNSTLYIINTAYDYGTKEESTIEKTLRDNFSGYTMSFHNDDIGMEKIPMWIIALAISILAIILLIMSSSWIEPLLFLVSIGVAVLLNMGTNIIMGEISEITFAISAILQLVLSMDYSIILINRYRQELLLTEDKFEAMKKALIHGVSSIVSSAATTVVGLLALVFMSFKIGVDFGAVLAKGVFLSMICTFTVLPALILLFDKLIHKTAKKVPEFKAGALASYSFKLRYVITGAFVVLFIAMSFLKVNTDTVYTMVKNDPIVNIFPPSNAIVMVYDNADDNVITDIAQGLTQNKRIDSMSSYSLTLGKEYTASQLTEKLATFGSDMNIDPALLRILYYNYYTKGTFTTITAGKFINFIANDVMNNTAFDKYFYESLKSNIDSIKKFADSKNLTKSMNVAELADFLGMSSDEVKGLLLLYHTKNGDINSGKMTLPIFADFITSDVVSNPDYASMLDTSTLSQMERLTTFTDTQKMTQKQSISGISKMLGMDAATAKMLFVYYYALSDSYNPNSMTLPAMVNFIAKDVAKNPVFSSRFDKATLAQMDMLAAFTDKNVIQAEIPPAGLATALRMDTAMVEQIFQMRYGADTSGKTMSMQAFVDFLLQTASASPEFAANLDHEVSGQLTFLQTVMKATLDGAPYTYAQMSGLLGMDASMTKMLYTFYVGSYSDTSKWKLSMQTIVNFLVNNSAEFGSMLDKNTLAELKMGQKLINGAVAGTQYTAKQLGVLLSLDAGQLDKLYLLYTSKHGDTGDWGISVQSFIGFVTSDVLSNKDYSDKFDADTTSQLKTAETLIDAVVSGKSYTAAELSETFGGLSSKLDRNKMEMLALYYASVNNSDPSWTLSISTLFNYLSENLLNDPRFSSFLDDSMRTNIDSMKVKIDDGAAQLRGPQYSRLIFETTFPAESAETTAFFNDLIAKCDSNLTGNYYLIGNSAMNYEMANTFNSEMNFITLLTAIAIFIVILLTFRSFSIPTILVLVIQCGVFLTISIIGAQGYSIYYLALLIVQCILMGATIDYGILFTTYYREKRQTMGIKEALAGAYHGAMHTILTSGSIMILVTGILGYCFENPTIGQICMTISQGALCATILILFILPGILASCDKLIMRKLTKKDKPVLPEVENS